MLNTKYIIILLSSLFLLINLTSVAQNRTEQETIADRFVAEKSYSEANTIYQEILLMDSNNYNIRYKYANSLRQQLNYSKAYTQYSKIISNNSDFTTEVYFHNGQMSKLLEKYNEAINCFSKYIIEGRNAQYRRIAEQELESCKYALAHNNDNNNIEITHLPPPINTEFSEFNSTQFSTSQMVFSRYYPQFTDSVENVFSQNYLSDIFQAKQSVSGWQKPKLFNERLSSNKYFSANICFTKNKREAYFTRCQDDNGSIGRCNIYYTKNKNGKWSKPKLVDKVNLDNFSSTHPYITEYESYSILYFSSNKPKGFGGNDIWYSIIRGGEIQEPQNIGSLINTSGDELNPFYDSYEQTLYFSSNKHKGFGGYDIFKISGANSSWKNLQNLGPKINSPSNDLYFTKGIGSDVAFLSSNRKGSFYHGDAESCCTDIYMVRYTLEEDEIISATDTINIKIIQEDSIVTEIKKLLPLSLYFENDSPDNNSIKAYTKTNYKDLLKEYIKLKELYKKEYSKGLNEENIAEAEQQIEDFFSNKVEHGFSDLNKLTALLKTELEKEKHVRIKIRGYASPLNNPEYNLALSKRRISSLKNFLLEYDNDYFAPFIKNTTDSINRLSIYEDPLGDSQSIGLVSDNPNDKRNSVYSREAALQRKIQIVMYSSDNNISTESLSYPILKWKIDTINLGTIKKGDNKSVVVYFENIGESELNISSFKPDCDCLQIQNPSNVLQAKSSSKIYALIKTDVLDAGDHIISLDYSSNALGKRTKLKFIFVIIE